jgi:hypothetical protein
MGTFCTPRHSLEGQNRCRGAARALLAAAAAAAPRWDACLLGIGRPRRRIALALCCASATAAVRAPPLAAWPPAPRAAPSLTRVRRRSLLRSQRRAMARCRRSPLRCAGALLAAAAACCSRSAAAHTAHAPHAPATRAPHKPAPFATSISGEGGPPVGDTPVGTLGTSTLTLNWLTAIDPLAVCNDGSPAGYYFAPGTGDAGARACLQRRCALRRCALRRADACERT